MHLAVALCEENYTLNLNINNLNLNNLNNLNLNNNHKHNLNLNHQPPNHHQVTWNCVHIIDWGCKVADLGFVTYFQPFVPQPFRS